MKTSPRPNVPSAVESLEVRIALAATALNLSELNGVNGFSLMLLPRETFWIGIPDLNGTMDSCTRPAD